MCYTVLRYESGNKGLQSFDSVVICTHLKQIHTGQTGAEIPQTKHSVGISVSVSNFAN